MMRADSTPTYVFEDDKVYAMKNGKVLAAADDVEELEDSDSDDKPDFLKKDHDDKKHDADDKGGKEEKESEKEEEEEEGEKKESTHILTPSGLKGKIISRTAGLWSDEVTVRLENGNIAHYHVLADTEFVSEEDEEQVNPILDLEEKLHIDYDESKESLVARRVELGDINRQARDLIQKGASSQDIDTLDKIAIQTEDEIAHIDDRLEQLDSDEAEAFAPPAPFETQVVEQGSVGHGDGVWLDNTLNEMIEEAEGFDYDNLMNEGPEAIVSEIDDVPLADQGAVQSIAAGVVREKTAAADPKVRDEFEKKFLARVEQVRRDELSRRKATAKKEASVQEDEASSAPDESLFL